LTENFDQRCRKIACRHKTELSKEIEETVSILTRKKIEATITRWFYTFCDYFVEFW
jgi:hypothetical protein